jgi:hypothetical protein
MILDDMEGGSVTVDGCMTSRTTASVSPGVSESGDEISKSSRERLAIFQNGAGSNLHGWID